MSIAKLKTKFTTGAWLIDVKHYFSKTNEIIDVVNELGGSNLGYKTNVSLFSQSGTSDPSVTEIQSTLSGPIVWTRGSAGQYDGTLTGEFPDINKVWISGMGQWTDSGTTFLPLSDGSDIIGYYTILWNSANALIIYTYDINFVATDLGDLIGTTKLCLPEIRVYE